MLHEVHDDPVSELETGCPPATLDWMIGWLRQEGWTFVSLDEVARRLRSGADDATRFVALTFDDGFRDTMTHALPVLERHRAPMAVYVPTTALNREMYSWWLGLREMFRSNDVVEIDALGSRHLCPELESKKAALDQVTRWVHQDYTRAQLLRDSFSKYNISLEDLNRQYFMNEAELREFSSNSLVTIGGHTTDHSALATLDGQAARSQVKDNRVYLQGMLNKRIDHFAYPYGYPKACGVREAELAASVGYSTAVTALDGPIPRVKPNIHLLPRVAAPAAIEPCALDGRISGVYRAGASLARSFGVLR